MSKHGAEDRRREIDVLLARHQRKHNMIGRTGLALGLLTTPVSVLGIAAHFGFAAGKTASAAERLMIPATLTMWAILLMTLLGLIGQMSRILTLNAERMDL